MATARKQIPADQLAALDALAAVVDKLAPGDAAFAGDLIYKGRKYGLSEKQAHWVGVLTERAQTPPPAPERVDLGGSLAPMLVMFQFARERLARPAVRLMTPEREVVRLRLAGEGAQHPGTINVDDGHGFGGNWYGRVTKAGEWEKSMKQQRHDPERMTRVEQVLRDFVTDPAQAAKAAAHLSGQCAFCARPLTDERSVKAGYGPQCADNYGLPWGDK